MIINLTNEKLSSFIQINFVFWIYVGISSRVLSKDDNMLLDGFVTFTGIFQLISLVNHFNLALFTPYYFW